MKKKKSIIICRCEEVTEEEIRKAIQSGSQDIDAVRRATRAGMGLCEGRSCRRLVAKILSEELRKPIPEIMPARFRPPARPVPIKLLGVYKTPHPIPPPRVGRERERGK